MAAALLPSPDPDPYGQPPFSTIEQGLSVIEAAGPEHLSRDALRGDLRWFASMRRALEAISARWLAELDGREEPALPDPVNSCAEWLHDELHLTHNAAHAQLRVARTLDHLPRTAAALRRGELGWQQVTVICRAMEQLHKTRLDPAEVEAELVGAAHSMDDHELHRHWLGLRYQADQEAGLEAEEEQRQRRWLRLHQLRSGSWRIEGELEAEAGSGLRTALQGLIGRPAKDDGRTPDQRRADALGELARRRLDAGDLPERGGERPHLMLVADLSTLRLEPGSRLAELDWAPVDAGRSGDIQRRAP